MARLIRRPVRPMWPHRKIGNSPFVEPRVGNPTDGATPCIYPLVRGPLRTVGVMRDEIEHAWQKAADCATRAQDATDPNIREFFIRLRNSWIGAANRAEFIAGMDQYLDAVERGSARISRH